MVWVHGGHLCIVISRLFGVHCLSSEIPSKICASGVWLCERLIQNIIQDMCVRVLCAGLLFVYSGISPIRCVCVLALLQNSIQDICVCAWPFVYISLIRCVMTLPRNIIQDTCVCASVCVCMAAVSVFGVFRDSFQIAFIVCVCSRVCVCVCVRRRHHDDADGRRRPGRRAADRAPGPGWPKKAKPWPRT